MLFAKAWLQCQAGCTSLWLHWLCYSDLQQGQRGRKLAQQCCTNVYSSPEAQVLKIQKCLNHAFDKHDKSCKIITILLEETFSNALIKLGIMTWTWSYKPLISSALMTSRNKRKEVSILMAETKNAQHTTTALISHATMDKTEKTKTGEPNHNLHVKNSFS